MVGRGRGADGEQPPPQAHRQDQRALSAPRAGARAARPRDGPARDGPAQRPGRAAPAGRGLPAQRGGPGELPRPAPRACRGPTEAPVDLGALLVLPGRGRGDAGRRRRPARRLARARRRSSPRPWRRLQAARAEEGRAMAAELLGPGRGDRRPPRRGSPTAGPRSSPSYQKRLTERVQALVQDQGVTIEPKDLIREVAILAERADIAEEIVRLRAHLDAVRRGHRRARERAAGSSNSSSRRWAARPNTIGSKANDVEISRERGRDQGAAGEDPRTDPERRVTTTTLVDRAELERDRGDRSRDVDAKAGATCPGGWSSSRARRARARARSCAGCSSGPSSGARLSVSATTRPPRPGEEHGRRLLLPEPRGVRGRRDRGELPRVGRGPRPLLRDARRARSARPSAEGVCVILEIDVQGALQVREKVPDALLDLRPGARASTSWRSGSGPGGPTTRRRSSGGWPTPGASSSWPDCYDVHVINDDLDRAVDELAEILVQQRLWRSEPTDARRTEGRRDRQQGRGPVQALDPDPEADDRAEPGGPAPGRRPRASTR